MAGRARASPVVCDVYDTEALEAVAKAQPEVVVHQLTDLPKAINPRKIGRQFAANDRLRVDGTRSLMRAAELAGARRVVAQSLAFAYAPDGAVAALVRKRAYPIAGDGGGIYSFVHVHVHDAVAATVAALDETVPPGAHNVVDDEPAPLRDWLPAYADALGAPPPRRLPVPLVRALAGRYGVYLMTQQRGASNAKAKRMLAWTPIYPAWRTGFQATLG